jgi:hypothetical protein
MTQYVVYGFSGLADADWQRYPILKSIDASNSVGLRAGRASVSSDRRAQDRANSREGHRRHSADKNST